MPLAPLIHSCTVLQKISKLSKIVLSPIQSIIYARVLYNRTCNLMQISCVSRLNATRSDNSQWCSITVKGSLGKKFHIVLILIQIFSEAGKYFYIRFVQSITPKLFWNTLNFPSKTLLISQQKMLGICHLWMDFYDSDFI